VLDEEETTAESINVLEVIDEDQENVPPVSRGLAIVVPKTPSARRVQDIKPASAKSKCKLTLPALTFLTLPG
jgi:hypothetical protein